MKAPKETVDRLNKIVTAWKKHAADKSFGGMTLPQFETEIAPSFTARDNLWTSTHRERERPTLVTMPTGIR